MLKRKFKSAYLLFFIIPFVYYLLSGNNRSDSPIERPDYFYFSAKSSQPASLKLLAGKDLLSSWNFNSEGFKFFNFSGNLKDSVGLIIEINNLKENDTVSFLSFNIFRNNEVFSLYDNQHENLVCSNGKVTVNDGVLNVIIQKANEPCTITFKASATWNKTETRRNFKIFIGFIFLIIFLIIIVIAPPVRYFIFTCLFTVATLFLTSYFKYDDVGKIKMSTVSPVKRAEFYYNECPQFTHLKRFSNDSCGNTFSAGIDLKSDRFIRLDVENISELKSLILCAKLGIFSKTWNIGNIPLGKLVINDLKVKNGNFYITDNDPFIALTSDYFFSDINWLILLGRSTFLFISLFSFIILLGLHFRFARYFNIQFRLSYLLFFTIPVAYYFLFNSNTKESHKKHLDYFYFSVKTSKPAVIALFTGQDSITSWNVNASG